VSRIRIFGSHLSRAERRVYGAVIVFYALALLAVGWPVYSWFNHARPLVLGMPFGLFYLAGVVIASFAVQLALLRWEIRRGKEGDS
jgi:TRAP-type C4-dicarboxylate transport system permease small subunit